MTYLHDQVMMTRVMTRGNYSMYYVCAIHNPFFWSNQIDRDPAGASRGAGIFPLLGKGTNEVSRKC